MERKLLSALLAVACLGAAVLAGCSDANTPPPTTMSPPTTMPPQTPAPATTTQPPPPVTTDGGQTSPDVTPPEETTAKNPASPDLADFSQYVKLADPTTLTIAGYQADTSYSSVVTGAFTEASTINGYSPELLTSIERRYASPEDTMDTEQQESLLKKVNELMVVATLAQKEGITVPDEEYQARLTALFASAAGTYASEEEYEQVVGKNLITLDLLTEKVERYLLEAIATREHVTVSDEEYQARLAELLQKTGDQFASKEELEASLGKDYVFTSILAEKLGALFPATTD